MDVDLDKYGYEDGGISTAHPYLLPVVDHIVSKLNPKKIFDLGCGNGAVGNNLSRYAPVTGVDPSTSGVAVANRVYPHLKICVGSAYDDLASIYGAFPLVVSLEVVEHLYDPKLYARNVFQLVEPGGHAVISTPYHGYLKNLGMAVTGKLDTHFTALWDGGHIKFFSVKTLTKLLKEVGFVDLSFRYAGRIPSLARSMIVTAKKPY